jgi:predicted porin
VDAGVAHLSAGGRSARGMTNSGLNSSRLGFRGVEDLGGGLKAGFWIEGALNNDTGEGGVAGGGFNFQRRSTVSLMGNFGEIRLGRDYTPSFYSTSSYDPFGTNGIGSSNMLNMSTALAPTINSTNDVRSSNAISYFLPSELGGFNGQIMYGFGENTSPGPKTNNYVGGRFGYAAGPVSAHVAYGKTEGATDSADTKYMNVGASYDFGVVKPMAVIGQVKNGAGTKIAAAEIGVVAPIGQSEIRAAYSRYDIKKSDNDWNKVALGYGYNLSKRTQLYATVARVSNKGLQTKSVANNGLSAGAASPGGSSSGQEFGIRHLF